MKIFGKILLLITGILFVILGITSVALGFVGLFQFNYSEFTTNVSDFINLLAGAIVGLVFFIGGIAGIIVFFHLSAKTAARVQKYAIIILAIAIITTIVQAVFMIIDVTKGLTIDNLPIVIVGIVSNLVLPILYYLGAYLSKRVLEKK
jgi:hypothetical protein